jgi:hypothetical protein
MRTGIPLPTGREEIAVHSAMVMLGYVNDPDHDRVLRGGWLRTAIWGYRRRWRPRLWAGKHIIARW